MLAGLGEWGAIPLITKDKLKPFVQGAVNLHMRDDQGCGRWILYHC